MPQRMRSGRLITGRPKNTIRMPVEAKKNSSRSARPTLFCLMQRKGPNMILLSGGNPLRPVPAADQRPLETAVAAVPALQDMILHARLRQISEDTVAGLNMMIGIQWILHGICGMKSSGNLNRTSGAHFTEGLTPGLPDTADEDSGMRKTRMTMIFRIMVLTADIMKPGNIEADAADPELPGRRSEKHPAGQ